MAAPITERFEELVLEVSEDGSTWTRICGLIGVTVTRTAQFDTTEVPADCDDESLPLQTERAIRATDVSISGDGVWAAQSHGTLIDWFYTGATKQVRVGNLNAASGDTEYETGPAFLSTLNNTRTKGQKVTASVAIQFDGTPERTMKV